MPTQNPKYNIVLGAKIAPKSLETLAQTITSFFANKTFEIKIKADTSQLERAVRDAGAGGAAGAAMRGGTTSTSGIAGTPLSASNVLGYTEAQNELGETLKRNVRIQQDANTVITEAQDSYGNLTGAVKSYDTGLKAQINATKRADTAYAKVKSRIKDLGDQHIIGTDAVKKFTQQLEEANKISNPAEREAEIKRINQAISDSKKQVMGFGSMLKTALEKFTIWSVVTVAWYKMVAALKDVVKEVVALDTALVELNKVADLTDNQTKQLTERAFRLAEQVGQTGLEAINAITEVKRAGFTLAESEEVAKYALMLTNVAEGITDAGDAAQILISILKGTGAEVSYANTLLDEMNEISNNSAIAFDALAHMTQRIAGTMHTLGASTEQTMSLVTGAYEVLQDERVAKGVSVIGLRISGLNEDLEEEAGLQSKVNDALMKYADISVFDEQTGQLRNYYDILSDLAAVWGTLDKNAKTYLTTELAGKNRADVLNALMNNWEGVTRAMAYAEQSAGSAAKEQERYLASVEGKLASLKNSWQELSTTTLDSDVVKGVLDLANAFVKLMNATGGLIPTLGLLAAAIITVKTVSKIDWATDFQFKITGIASAFKATQLAATGAAGAMVAFKISVAAVTAVVSLLVMAISAVNAAQQQAIANAQSAADKAKTQSEKIKDLVDQYRELSEAQSAEGWTAEQRKKVETIQSSITSLVGEEAKNLDLVNGKLDEQYEKLSGISQLSKDAAEGAAQIALMSAAKPTVAEYLQTGKYTLTHSPTQRTYLEEQGLPMGVPGWDPFGAGGQVVFGGSAEDIVKQYEAVKAFQEKVYSAQARGEGLYNAANELIYRYEDLPQLSARLQYYLDKVGTAAERYQSILSLTEGTNGSDATPAAEDLVLKRMEAELKALKEQQAALKSVNEQQEKELELQKKLLAVEEAREALAQAKNKRILVYRAGRGMVYEQDYSEVEKAQKSLASAQKSLSDYEVSAGLDPLSKKIIALEGEMSERSKLLASQSSSSTVAVEKTDLPTLTTGTAPTPNIVTSKTAQPASAGSVTNYNIENLDVNYEGKDLAALAGSIRQAAARVALSNN